MAGEIRKWAMVILAVVLMYRFIERDNLIGVIYQSLPHQEAGLMAGMVMGDKTGLDKNFYEELQNSGLVHLVVVSGSNVMLLVGGLIEMGAQFLGRKKTIVGGLALGWGYVGLAQWGVSAVRAMLLMSIFYFAQLVGRKYNLFRGVVLAVLIMMLADIRVLISASFWLSMMAFLGMTTYKNIFNENFLSKILLKIFKTLMPSIWVSVWITPILGMIFGKVSLLSPITNLLVMGIVEVATMIGMIGMVTGIKQILWLALPWLKYLIMVVNWGGSDRTVWSINFNWLMLIGWYLILTRSLKLKFG